MIIVLGIGILLFLVVVCIVALFRLRPPAKPKRKLPPRISDDTMELPLLEYSFRTHQS